MTPKLQPITFTGLNNRASEYAKPSGKLAAAVNVQFDDAGNVQFPRAGTTKVYDGASVHSLYNGSFATLFVDNSNLMGLDSSGAAFVILALASDNPVYYCEVADSIYWANGIQQGVIKDRVSQPWGIARPPRQPDVFVVDTGGMYAGDYRIAITWIGSNGIESGAGTGRRVTVNDGGGIVLSNFPTPPGYVNKVAVYVSSINSKGLYLYGEYPANIDTVKLGRRICDIPLRTQHGYPPAPTGNIYSHSGRIYYPRGSRLYRTATRNYHLQFANSYWRFDSDIQVVISSQNLLYVGTKHRIYRLSNIDGDGVATVEVVKNYGAVKGTECYDPIGGVAYFCSDHGFIRVSPGTVDVDPLTELNYQDVAMPFFDSGSMTVIERDGLKYLVGVFKGGKDNSLVAMQ